MIKNVIFDFGGVLVDWEPLLFFKKRFKTEEEAKKFVNFMMPYNLLLDAGFNCDSLMKVLEVKYEKWAEHIKIWDKEWESYFIGENKETLNLVKRLHKNNIPMYGITNWQKNKEYYLHEKLNFMPYMKQVVISGIEEIVKPDKRIYELLIQRAYIKPEETLFVDDVLDNVKGAEKVGLKAHHFINSANLEEKLLKENLIT